MNIHRLAAEFGLMLRRAVESPEPCKNIAHVTNAVEYTLIAVGEIYPESDASVISLVHSKCCDAALKALK